MQTHPSAAYDRGAGRHGETMAAFGTDLTNVNTITIGVGTKGVPGAGAGTGYFDDIRLIP